MANYREFGKIWSARVLLVCSAVGFVWSLSSFLKNQIRFRDVASWPTVSAQDARVVPRTIEITSGGRYGGTSTHWLEVFTVDFTYVLDGVTYEGAHFTPDNRVPDSDLLPSYDGFPWLAYYSPRDPSLAVLVPFPYLGTRELIVLCVSGLALLTALCRWGIWPSGRICKDGLRGAIARHWFGWWCAVLLGFSLWMAEREARVDSRSEEATLRPEIERWLGGITRSYHRASPGWDLPDFVLKEEKVKAEGVDGVDSQPLPELPVESFRVVWERERIRKLFHRPHRPEAYGFVAWGSGILLSLYSVLILMTSRIHRQGDDEKGTR